MAAETGVAVPAAPLCRDLAAQLGLYLEGEAGAGVCAALEAHLATCADCRALVATLRKTIQLAHDLPPPPLPDGARQRLLDAMSQFTS